MYGVGFGRIMWVDVKNGCQLQIVPFSFGDLSGIPAARLQHIEGKPSQRNERCYRNILMTCYVRLITYTHAESS